MTLASNEPYYDGALKTQNFQTLKFDRFDKNDGAGIYQIAGRCQLFHHGWVQCIGVTR
ncbi:MAG: hypothetical protein ABIK45_03165 [Pseudomonadota bacterium]